VYYEKQGTWNLHVLLFPSLSRNSEYSDFILSFCFMFIR
jgi:hypothetical protein